MNRFRIHFKMPKDSKRKRHLRACGKKSAENFKKRLKSDQEWISEERKLLGTYEESFALERMKSYFSEHKCNNCRKMAEVYWLLLRAKKQKLLCGWS
jgi:hypothetical protein